MAEEYNRFQTFQNRSRYPSVLIIPRSWVRVPPPAPTLTFWFSRSSDKTPFSASVIPNPPAFLGKQRNPLKTRYPEEKNFPNCVCPIGRSWNEEKFQLSASNARKAIQRVLYICAALSSVSDLRDSGNSKPRGIGSCVNLIDSGQSHMQNSSK